VSCVSRVGLPRNGSGGARITIETADVARPIVGIAFRGPAASAGSSAYAAQIVAALLGRSDAGGRLSTPQLSGSEARVSFGPRKDSSLFIITTTIPITTLQRSQARADFSMDINSQRDTVLAVLDGLTSSPPTAGEVRAAKSALIGRAIFDGETTTGLASAIGMADVTGGAPPDEWRAAIEQTTVAEVREFVRQWLGSAQRVELALTPAARRGESNAE
jgi:predicted Zn-dependent peptidase